MKTIIKNYTIFLLALVTAGNCLAAGNSSASTNADTPSPILRLKMAKDTINTDEIVITCATNGSLAYIAGVDAVDFGGIGAQVNLSSMSTDNMPIAINTVPFPGIQQEEIPLLTDATASGIYKLESTQVVNWPSIYELWLKDGFTGDSLKLTTNASYSFHIDKNNAATFGKGRFKVIIRQNVASAYQLADFTAAKAPAGNSVQLAWKMINEQSGSHFSVERSVDTAKAFIQVDSLAGTGAGNYYVTDNNPMKGQDNYRVKLTDSAGIVSYSPLVSIQNTVEMVAGANLQVYPNPAVNQVSINIIKKATETSDSYNITVTNSNGAVVTKASSAQPTWQSSVSTLRPGIYLIQVINTRNNSLVGQTKFVKL